jgi:hypothetical protein
MTATALVTTAAAAAATTAAATALITLTTAGLLATLLAATLVTLVSLILFRHPCFPPCWCFVRSVPKESFLQRRLNSFETRSFARTNFGNLDAKTN